MMLLPSRRWLVGGRARSRQRRRFRCCARGRGPAAGAGPGLGGRARWPTGWARRRRALSRSRREAPVGVRRGSRRRRALPVAASPAPAPHPRVRERLPDPLGGADTPTRRLLVPPARGLEERVELVPRRRGAGDGGTVAIRVLGALGLGWRQETVELPWTATVYPTLPARRSARLPLQAARRREAGLRTIRRPGEGRLFEGLREWVPGDETRVIDWKATARRASRSRDSTKTSGGNRSCW